ncbi:hypothetical protein EG68_06112 [Paragonimus skrjabini miyazakii]|uniref:Uncharacterized protein n=1 Tax=Paragonimus skrjabini miyazakii TaxID=59628 RepID=A0A8S9YAR9_9TREM|nr:hypothetical protein EG68_06112 [Paragonimus skrjabini miyazakii]
MPLLATFLRNFINVISFQLHDLHDIIDRESLIHQHIVNDFNAETSSLSTTFCLQTRSVREHTDLRDSFEVSTPIHFNFSGYNGTSVLGTLSPLRKPISYTSLFVVCFELQVSMLNESCNKSWNDERTRLSFADNMMEELRQLLINRISQTLNCSVNDFTTTSMKDHQINVLASTNGSTNKKILFQVVMNLSDTDCANSLADAVVHSVHRVDKEWLEVNVTVVDSFRLPKRPVRVFLIQCVPRLFRNSTLSNNASVQANTSEYFDTATDLKISLYWHFKHFGWNSYDYNVDVIRLSSEESLLKLWINESQVDLRPEGHLHQQLEHVLRRIIQSYSNEPFAWIKSFKLTEFHQPILEKSTTTTPI